MIDTVTLRPVTLRPVSPAPAAQGRFIAGLLGGLVAALALWAARHRQRRELGELDERLLRDIGVTRGEALREAAKPFWRA